jgi:N-acetylglutamate synthase-like GNAT family acetyltransferase
VVFFIRSAGEADLKTVSALLDRESHMDQGPHTIAALKAQLMRPDSEFVVADDGKRIAGMAYAAMDKDEGDVVILHQLAVDHDFAGQGIGRDLFAEVETCFPAAKQMRVQVEAANEKAIDFFKGLGFSDIGWAKTAGAPGAEIHALILGKELTF